MNNVGKFLTDRRGFIVGGVAACAMTSLADVEAATRQGIKVRFLGSGAAGGEDSIRKCSSILIEDKILVDLTPQAFAQLPKDAKPEVIFQTHSHGDHYSPFAIVKLGLKRVYLQESWAAAAKREIAAEAAKQNAPAPEVIALPFGKKVVEFGIAFTGVPANHSTSRITDGVLERTSLYLIERDSTRLLYATDTGGIPGDAARMIGIDPHVRKDNYARYDHTFVHEPQALTAIIMEATDGLEDANYRMFVHSSVQLVSRTVNGLLECKRYCPPPGQSVYLTHLALRYREWPSEQIDAELPYPLKSAYDGLELTFR